MKRYSLPLLLFVALVIGAGQLPHLVAQTAPVPPGGGGAGPEIPGAPAPVPPPAPPGGGLPYGDPLFMPGMPGMPGMSGMPGMLGMPGGMAAGMPGMGMTPMMGPPLAHASQPADPRVIELTERYNKLEQQVMQLAHEFRQSEPEGEKREKLQQQITEVTNLQFQLRHEVRQLEVERLQKQLTTLQEQLQRREEKKQEIIDRRVAQLTDQGDELRWDPLTPPGTNRYTPAGPVFAPGMPGSWVSPTTGGAMTFDGAYLPGSPTGLAPGDPFSARGAPFPPGTQPVPSLPSRNRDPNTAAMPSVNEAEARLAIAERELARVKAQHDVGMIPVGDFERAEGAVQLGKILLEEARRDQELQVKMLELSVRRAEAELDGFRAELDAVTQRSDRKKDDPDLTAQVRHAAAAVQQKQVELDQMRVMFERQLQRTKPAHDPAEK